MGGPGAARPNTATRWQFWKASRTPKWRSSAPRIASGQRPQQLPARRLVGRRYLVAGEALAVGAEPLHHLHQAGDHLA
jgi:hypothetical protein